MRKLLLLFLAMFVAGCVRTEEHARGSDEGGFAVKEALEYFEQNAEEFELLGLLSGQAQDGTRAVW